MTNLTYIKIALYFIFASVVSSALYPLVMLGYWIDWAQTSRYARDRGRVAQTLSIQLFILLVWCALVALATFVFPSFV